MHERRLKRGYTNATNFKEGGKQQRGHDGVAKIKGLGGVLRAYFKRSLTKLQGKGEKKTKTKYHLLWERHSNRLEKQEKT